VGADEVGLELAEIVPADALSGERAEAGVDAVVGLGVVEGGVEGGAAGGDAGAGGGIECDRKGMSGDVGEVVGGEGGAVESEWRQSPGTRAVVVRHG
jgi:hypothetical protein